MFSISQIPFSSLNQRIQCRFSTMIKSVGFFLHTGWFFFAMTVGFFLHTGWVFSEIPVGFFLKYRLGFCLAGWFFFPKYGWVFFPEHGWFFSRTRLVFSQNTDGFFLEHGWFFSRTRMVFQKCSFEAVGLFFQIGWTFLIIGWKK